MHGTTPSPLTVLFSLSRVCSKTRAERDSSGSGDEGFEDEARADEVDEAAGSPGVGDNSEDDEVDMDQSKASTRDEDEEPEDHGIAGTAIEGNSSAGGNADDSNADGSNATNGKTAECGDNDSADVGNGGGSDAEGADAPLETAMDGDDKGSEGEVCREGTGGAFRRQRRLYSIRALKFEPRLRSVPRHNFHVINAYPLPAPELRSDTAFQWLRIREQRFPLGLGKQEERREERWEGE